MADKLVSKRKSVTLVGPASKKRRTDSNFSKMSKNHESELGRFDQNKEKSTDPVRIL